MKIAALGAGAWGKNIVRTLASLEALAAVVEPDEVTRTALQRDLPEVAFYADPEPILQSDLPAVAIATPVPTHAALVRTALQAGKDVFVEKPICLSADEAQELTDLAETQGRVLMVGHLLLYQPAVQWIKGFLDSGGIGKLHSLHQERLNLGRARAVENVLWSLGVHDVAVALFLVGARPDGIHSVGQRALGSGVEDDFYLHLDFPDNVQAHLHASWLWPEKRRRTTLIGSQGMLVYEESDQTVTLHRKSIGANLTNRDEGSEIVFHGSGEPLQLEMKHFLDSIMTRQTPLSSGASAVEVIRVLEQAS